MTSGHFCFLPTSQKKIHSHFLTSKTKSSKANMFVYFLGFCEKIDGENCPKKLRKPEVHGNLISEVASTDELLKMFLQEIINNMDLVISISLTAMTVLLFTFGYYCISKSRKEGPLIGKVSIRFIDFIPKEPGTYF